MLVIFCALAAVAAFVTAPLRRARAADEDRERADRLEELEARKEAKYREIRDAEMDHRTGKLSEADWKALDRTLRAEAVEILRAIDDSSSDVS